MGDGGRFCQQPMTATHSCFVMARPVRATFAGSTHRRVVRMSRPRRLRSLSVNAGWNDWLRMNQCSVEKNLA
jgi:hypothetical protein